MPRRPLILLRLSVIATPPPPSIQLEVSTSVRWCCAERGNPSPLSVADPSITDSQPSIQWPSVQRQQPTHSPTHSGPAVPPIIETTDTLPNTQRTPCPPSHRDSRHTPQHTADSLSPLSSRQPTHSLSSSSLTDGQRLCSFCHTLDSRLLGGLWSQNQQPSTQPTAATAPTREVGLYLLAEPTTPAHLLDGAVLSVPKRCSMTRVSHIDTHGIRYEQANGSKPNPLTP